VSNLISYCGVPLLHVSEAMADWVARTIPLRAIIEDVPRWWPGPALAGLPFNPPPPPWPVEANVLRWPTNCASRYAIFHGMVSDSQLALIRAAVYGGSGSSYTSGLFVMDDGLSRISTQLFLLPPRPLAQLSGPPGWWLITLVDDRFFWWFRGAQITVNPGVTAWTDLYSQIGAALGVTITPDAVSASYLTPAADFGQAYQDLPLMLDAVCYACGQRLVRGLDGTVVTQNATTAAASVAVQLARVNSTTGPQGRAGGVLALLPPYPDDINADLPSSVTVTCPGANFGTPEPVPVVYTVTLASLALAEAGSAIGFNGTKVFRTSAVADFQGGITPANNAQLQALANQIATDYYRWALSRLDLVLTGAWPWTAEGMSERIEWQQNNQAISTRILRGPFRTEAEDLPQVGSFGSISAAGSLTVQLATGLPSVPDVDLIQFGAGFSLQNPGPGVALVDYTPTVRVVGSPPTNVASSGTLVIQLPGGGGTGGPGGSGTLWISAGGGLWLAFCPCATSSGSGSGSGSGGGAGSGVPTACWPGVLVPTTLTGTFTNQSCPGMETCLNGHPLTFTYQGLNGLGEPSWLTPLWSLCSMGMGHQRLELTCHLGTWQLNTPTGFCLSGGAVNASDAQYDPFIWDFHLTILGDGACCAAAGTVDFTITQ
jgi:hypothetical protein